MGGIKDLFGISLMQLYNSKECMLPETVKAVKQVPKHSTMTMKLHNRTRLRTGDLDLEQETRSGNFDWKIGPLCI
jgi:hypothetical protein